jgi:hypothetical protein
MDVKEIRQLVRRFSPEQIDQCLGQQLETGVNVCLKDASSEKIISELAKAGFVRELVEKGVSLPDALRELAHRMREFLQMTDESNVS